MGFLDACLPQQKPKIVIAFHHHQQSKSRCLQAHSRQPLVQLPKLTTLQGTEHVFVMISCVFYISSMDSFDYVSYIPFISINTYFSEDIRS